MDLIGLSCHPGRIVAPNSQDSSGRSSRGAGGRDRGYFTVEDHVPWRLAVYEGVGRELSMARKAQSPRTPRTQDAKDCMTSQPRHAYAAELHHELPGIENCTTTRYKRIGDQLIHQRLPRYAGYASSWLATRASPGPFYEPKLLRLATGYARYLVACDSPIQFILSYGADSLIPIVLFASVSREQLL